MNPNHNTLLSSLQVGRAVAALAVVVHHSIFTANVVFADVPHDWYHLFKLGYLGVDYFFVLSGFIIAHATRNIGQTRADARRYGLARAIRIYVPYLPACLGLLAMLAVMDALGMSGERDSFSVLASLTLLPSNTLPALSVAWTLQHEVVFYALFGLCFFVFKDPRLIFLWAAAIIGLLFFSVTDRWWNVAAGFINLEFLFGVAACYAYHSGRFYAQRYILLGVGAALIGTAGYLLHGVEVIHYYRVLAGLGFSAIVLGLVHMERDTVFSNSRRLLFLGAASYSLYLVHVPFLSIIAKLPLHLPHWIVAFVLFITISCLAGIIYYVMIERPLMGFVRKRVRI